MGQVSLLRFLKRQGICGRALISVGICSISLQRRMTFMEVYGKSILDKDGNSDKVSLMELSASQLSNGFV